MKYAVVLLSALLSGAVYGQQTRSLAVLFANNKHVLSPQARNSLDSMLRSLEQPGVKYTVVLGGHTDINGSLSYNEALSWKRAAAVRRYLVSKGFGPDRIRFSAFAFLQPVADNGNEHGRSMNRRVTLQFSAAPDLPLQSVPITFTLSPAKGHTSTCLSGTRVKVPAGAFETVNGDPVTGPVEIQFTEYRNPVEFLGSGIPMSFYDEKGEFVQFNSAGMFRIEAFAGGEPLKLKSDKAVDVSLAKTQDVPGLGIYYFDEPSGKWLLQKDTQTAKSGNFDFQAMYIGRPDMGLSSTGPGIGVGTSPAAMYFARERESSHEICYCAKIAVRNGLRLARGKAMVSLAMPALYYQKKPAPSIPAYRMSVVEKQPEYTRFVIMPDTSAWPSANAARYIWEIGHSPDRPFIDSWSEESWLRIRIGQVMGEECQVSLSNNGSSVSFVARLHRIDRSRSKKSLANIVRRSSATRMPALYNELWRDPYKIHNRTSPCYDSLYCVYRGMKALSGIAGQEINMDFGSWWDYFNAHKKEMAARLEPYARDPQLLTAACAEFDKAMRERLRRDSINWATSALSSNTVYDLTSEIKVTRLGVWNCDQVYRLREPVYVKAKYRTVEGDSIAPVTVAVIDPQVNGVLTYGPYSPLNPFFFPVSSASRNMLIAFDERQDIYFSDAPAFGEAVKTQDKTIRLKKMTRDELTQAVAANFR